MPTMKPSALRAWLLATRPKTLLAGAVPVIVAASLASSEGHGTLWPACAALVGSLLIQIGTNLVNDLADFKRGVDGPDRLGPARATSEGWLSIRQVGAGAALCLGLAALIGVYIIAVGGWPLAVLGLVSLVCAVAYTAGPFPLAYVGLGDLFVLLFFGLGAVCGTYYLMCHQVSLAAVTAGLSLGALATAIIVVNNLRDRVGDAKADKRTLAVRFGPQVARWEYAFLVVLAYASVVLAVAVAWAPVGWLLCLTTCPLAYREVKAVWRKDGAALNPHLGRTAALETAFGATLALGSFA